MLHGRLVVFLFQHFSLEHFTDQARQAFFLLCGMDLCPSGDIFIQGDRDILHDTNIVQHEFRVKMQSVLHLT